MPSRRAAARAAHDAILAKLREIEAQATAAEANAQGSVAVGNAQSLRQQRAGILGRLLRLGRVEQDDEMRALNKQIASAENVERQAAAIGEALSSVLAELRAEAANVAATLPAAKRELAEAVFEAATADLTANLLPRYVAAADALRDAYAAVAGAGKAHHQLAAEVREVYGVSVSALGQLNPLLVIGVLPVPIGFGLTSGGGYNVLNFDVSAAIRAAESDAIRRWRAS